MSADGGGWIVVQRRFSGGLDFNASWAAFAAGFGVPGGEQWLGNENLWRLTTALAPTLRIEETRTSGEQKIAQYSTFQVAAASDMYRLTVGGYRVVQEQTTPCLCYRARGDCLAYHSGAQFDTYDRSNGAAGGTNCAVLCPGGWWYKNCYSINLNLVYGCSGTSYYTDECFAALNEFIPVTRMLIRETTPVAGSGATCVACPSGTWSAVGSTTCTNCSAGSWAGPGAPSCQACAAGTFASSPGASHCTTCPAGAYSPAPGGAAACTPCPIGTALNTTGGTSGAACIPCVGGRYSAPGSASCALCVDGLHVGPDGGCIPTAPVILSAVAANTGGEPGLGARDTILVATNVDIDRSTAVVSPVNVSLGHVLSYTWLTNRSLLVTVVDASGASDAALTRIGALSLVGVLARADHALPAAAVAAVAVTGSWGAYPAPGILSAVARDGGAGRSPSGVLTVAPGLSVGDALTVTFDMDTNTPPAGSVLSLSAGIGVVVAAWASPRLLVVTVTDVSAGCGPPAATRVGTLTVHVSGDLLRSRDASSPPSAANGTVSGGWGNGVAFLRTAGGDPATLSTAGGEVVTLSLAATLGAGGDPVSASYSNGAGRTYAGVACAVAPDGAAVACRTAPGVGAGFAWTLTLNGAPLAPSTSTTSYAPPVISGAAIDASAGGGGGGGSGGSGGGNGTTPALPTGGQLVRITGRNFGSTAESAISDASFSPRGYDALVFYPTACAVTANDTQVSCVMPPFTGSNFVFSFKIGGQDTTESTLGAAPPEITWVSADAPLAAGGRTRVTLHGSYFGVVVSPGVAAAAAAAGTPLVVVQYGAGLAFTAVGCAVSVPQREISCTSAPGYGTGLLWRVTLLGVPSNTLSCNVSYAPPAVTAATGPPPSTGGGSVITLSGTNFADAYPSVVAVLIDGAPVPPAAVAVLGNGTLSVSVGPGVGRHAAAVRCDTQVSNAVPFWYAAPTVSSAGVVGGAGSSRLVAISGSGFGVNASLVSVAIGGASCAVTSVADTVIGCSTAANRGAVVVTVAGNASTGSSYTFDAAAAQPAPILTGVVNLTALPLVGGGIVALSGGSLLPPLPAIDVVLRLDAANATALTAMSAINRSTAVCPAAVRVALAASSTSGASGAATTGGSDSACTATTRTTISIACTLPPSDVRVTYVVVVNVVGVTCQASSVWSVVYDAPAVRAVAPRTLRPTGGELLHLWGANFPAAVAVAVGGRPCTNATRANESYVTCVTPPGYGAAAAVVVNGVRVAGVAYAPPSVAAVVPSSGVAGDVLRVSGVNLWGGGAVAVVHIGGWAASVVVPPSGGDGSSTQATSLRVIVPIGVGAGWGLDVAVGDQNSTLPRAFSYAPPSVRPVAFVDGAAGGAVNVTGRGFGPPSVPLAVDIGGVPCDAVRHDSDVQAVCVAPPSLLLGPCAVRVVAGGQAGAGPADVECPVGYYGAAGERCAGCPARRSPPPPPTPVARTHRLWRRRRVHHRGRALQLSPHRLHLVLRPVPQLEQEVVVAYCLEVGSDALVAACGA